MTIRTLLILLLLAQSCATAPRIGVRTGFESRRVKTIAVAPVWSVSTFGNDPDTWRQIEREAASSALENLALFGFEIVDPEALRDDLERTRRWERFAELLHFADGLDNRFEPSLYAPPTSEVRALRELVAEAAFPSRTVIFVEVVYHSAGHCTVDAREHSRFAVVVSASGEPVDPRGGGSCIVTHIQAKLVDVETAQTMWHNRVLRELRTPELTPDTERKNVRATTQQVIGGAHGLGPLAPVSH